MMRHGLILSLVACVLCVGCGRDVPPEPGNGLADASEAELREFMNDPDPNVRYEATMRLIGPAPVTREKMQLYKPLLFDEGMVTNIGLTTPESIQVISLMGIWARAREHDPTDLEVLVPELAALVEEEDRGRASVAAEILGEIGPLASDAMPSLRWYCETEAADSERKWRVAFAMEKIEPGSMAGDIRAAILNVDTLPYVVDGTPGRRSFGPGPVDTRFMRDFLDMYCRIESGEVIVVSEDFSGSDVFELLLDYGQEYPELAEVYRGYLGRGIDEQINQIIAEAIKVQNE